MTKDSDTRGRLDAAMGDRITAADMRARLANVDWNAPDRAAKVTALVEGMGGAVEFDTAAPRFAPGTRFVLVIGDAGAALEFVGPFDSPDDAAAWADAREIAEHWLVCDLIEPHGGDTSAHRFGEALGCSETGER